MTVGRQTLSLAAFQTRLAFFVGDMEQEGNKNYTTVVMMSSFLCSERTTAFCTCVNSNKKESFGRKYLEGRAAALFICREDVSSFVIAEGADNDLKVLEEKLEGDAVLL